MSLMASSSSSKTSINDLPMEILLEILYKVPVKQLHQKKTVCKYWSSLISHRSFGTKYSSLGIRRNINDPSLTFYHSYHHDSSYDLHSVEHITISQNHQFQFGTITSEDNWEFLPLAVAAGTKRRIKIDYKVLASTNGILLLSTRELEDNIIFNPQANVNCCFNYYICNPLTKKLSNKIPSPSTAHSPFDLWGFVCYQSTTNQFKIVKIVNPPATCSSNTLKIEVFDSSTDQWCVFNTNTPTLDAHDIFRIDKINAVEHKGVLFWLTDHDFVMAFDPKLNIYHHIPLPESPLRDRVKHSFLGVSQDRLYYVQVKFEFNPNTLFCTMLRCDNFDGEYSWSFHDTFDLECIRRKDIRNLKLDGDGFQALAIDPLNSNVLYVSAFDPSSETFTIYWVDLRRAEAKELYSIPKDSEDYYDSYTNTMVMLVQATWPTTVPHEYTAAVQVHHDQSKLGKKLQTRKRKHTDTRSQFQQKRGKV